MRKLDIDEVATILSGTGLLHEDVSMMMKLLERHWEGEESDTPMAYWICRAAHASLCLSVLLREYSQGRVDETAAEGLLCRLLASIEDGRTRLMKLPIRPI